MRKHGATIEVPPFLQQISSTPHAYQSSRNSNGQTLGTFLASAQSQTSSQTASNLFYNSTNTIKTTTTKRLSGSRDAKGKKGSSGNLSKYVTNQHNPKQMDTTSSRSKSKSKDLTLSSDTSNKSLIKTVSHHKPQDVTVTSQYSVSDPNIMMAAYSKSSH